MLIFSGFESIFFCAKMDHSLNIAFYSPGKIMEYCGVAMAGRYAGFEFAGYLPKVLIRCLAIGVEAWLEFGDAHFCVNNKLE